MIDYSKYKLEQWLPTTAKEIKARAWDSVDVILFSGDAYVDHPSFGSAVIARVLESKGLKVAIVSQPNWRDDLRDFKKLGKPNLFFAVTSGCMDSMVNHYTANKRKRSDDAYTADGRSGQRPDYATIVYSKILKKLFPEVPVVIGGIEASLRRLTHYDYWSDQLKPGILHDSQADLLVYGMGEKCISQLVEFLQKGIAFDQLTTIPQTAFIRNEKFATNKKWDSFELFSHDECLTDKLKYAKNFKSIETESNSWYAKQLVQKIGNRSIVVNPQFEPSTAKELDEIYALPFTRLPHPKYKDKRIPAYEMIRHSVNIHRGCFGGCAFCTISAHQGKFVSNRSPKSVLDELKQVSEMPDFKGIVSDLGGPSANMYQMAGKDLSSCKKCKRPSCIDPDICKNLNTDHKALTELYDKALTISTIKKVFIGSGIRYDMILRDGQKTKNNLNYLKQVIQKHISGRLKVAPEHTDDQVLKIMRKPTFGLFKELITFFKNANREAGLNQQLIPYFISSHPGSTNKSMAKLMLETQKLDFKLEQVQDFTPTPMTVSTVIYYSGVHPYTLKPVYTAKSKNEKLEQRKFFFWYKPEYKKRIESEISALGISKKTTQKNTRKKRH